MDLWVMGPARFHCATLLLTDNCGFITAFYRLLLLNFSIRTWNSFAHFLLNNQYFHLNEPFVLHITPVDWS